MKIVEQDWLVKFADGIELEITGPRRANQKLTPGHARSIAIDYLERTGRKPAVIVSTTRLTPDKGRHEERVKAAIGTLPDVGRRRPQDMAALLPQAIGNALFGTAAAPSVPAEPHSVKSRTLLPRANGPPSAMTSGREFGNMAGKCV